MKPSAIRLGEGCAEGAVLCDDDLPPGAEDGCGKCGSDFLVLAVDAYRRVQDEEGSIAFGPRFTTVVCPECHGHPDNVIRALADQARADKEQRLDAIEASMAAKLLLGDGRVVFDYVLPALGPVKVTLALEQDGGEVPTLVDVEVQAGSGTHRFEGNPREWARPSSMATTDFDILRMRVRTFLSSAPKLVGEAPFTACEWGRRAMASGYGPRCHGCGATIGLSCEQLVARAVYGMYLDGEFVQRGPMWRVRLCAACDRGLAHGLLKLLERVPPIGRLSSEIAFEAPVTMRECMRRSDWLFGQLPRGLAESDPSALVLQMQGEMR